MDSSVQRWQTEHNSLSIIKERRDLGTRRFRGDKLDITDYETSDLEPCHSEVANWT